jgi:EF hand
MSSSEGVVNKQKGGGLFRRKNNNKESSSSSPTQPNDGSKPSSEPRRNIFSGVSSPLRRQRAQEGGGGGGGSQTSKEDGGAAAAEPSSTLTTAGQSYESYYNNNTVTATGSFDADGSSFHSAQPLKNVLEDHTGRAAAVKKNKRATTTTTSTTTRAATTSSWLCRTKYFRNMCDAAFETIDQDESGSVDEKELYSGLLLIHLQLGMYAGPAACKPLGRERVSKIFYEMDVDRSGSLDRDEFRAVMMLLFSNVVFRVMVQWSMTLMIVPCIARSLLDAIYATLDFLYNIVTNLDEYSHMANAFELTLEAIGEAIVDHLLPSIVVKLAATAHFYLQTIPDAVWNSIPLTLLSTILGMLVVPYLILQVDDFFQHLAARKVTTAATATNKKFKC